MIQRELQPIFSCAIRAMKKTKRCGMQSTVIYSCAPREWPNNLPRVNSSRQLRNTFDLKVGGGGVVLRMPSFCRLMPFLGESCFGLVSALCGKIVSQPLRFPRGNLFRSDPIQSPAGLAGQVQPVGVPVSQFRNGYYVLLPPHGTDLGRVCIACWPLRRGFDPNKCKLVLGSEARQGGW
jgi:hypothetical protein